MVDLIQTIERIAAKGVLMFLLATRGGAIMRKVRTWRNRVAARVGFGAAPEAEPPPVTRSEVDGIHSRLDRLETPGQNPVEDDKQKESN